MRYERPTVVWLRGDHEVHVHVRPVGWRWEVRGLPDSRGRLGPVLSRGWNITQRWALAHGCYVARTIS